MSFISNLISRWFGKKKEVMPEAVQPAAPSADTGFWQMNYEQRLAHLEEGIKDWLVALVKEKQQLGFSWESGNDEAFIYYDDYPNADSNEFVDLEQYLILKLDIPDAGEFQMDGKGHLYLANNTLRAKYAYTIKLMEDFDEETEEPTYGEEESDEKDVVLFAC